MDKKLVSGIAYGLVFIGFVAVSLLVIISKRNSFFIRKKLQLGALLIFLSGATPGCTPFVTCYAPIPDNYITVDQTSLQHGEIVISTATGGSISGTITNRTENAFSYVIMDSANAVILSDNIFALDGAYDESWEEFIIIIPENSIAPGNYFLRFYKSSAASILNINSFYTQYSLTVIN